MSFTASTARRVLYEGSRAAFLYPIGNTPAVAMLPAGESRMEPPRKALLLACGDPRNTLATAAALGRLVEVPTAAAADSIPPLVEVHLNDLADPVLARNVLLLAFAATMDPSSSEDVAFLFAIWFCAALTREHRARLDTLLQQAIDGELPACIVLAESPASSSSSSVGSRGRPLKQRLQAIWRTWRACNKTLQPLLAERKEFMMFHMDRRRQLESAKGTWSWEEHLQESSLAADKFVADAGDLSQAAKEAIAAEIRAYIDGGSITSSGRACKGPAINPTLLDEQGVWRVHDSCSPFECFPPLTQQQLQGLGDSSSLPGLLTRSAQEELRRMVLQYQDAASQCSGAAHSSSSAALRFVLHGGDAVDVCGTGSSLGDDARFDAIDCSNVGDHVGVLNMLLAAGPRLRGPRSRLTAATMVWETFKAATCVTDFLTAALGGPASELPTLLGLRLCSETRLGRLEPYSLSDRVATRSRNTRILVFAPAAASAAAALERAAQANSRRSSSRAPDSECASSTLVLPAAIAPGSSSKNRTRGSGGGLQEALLHLEALCCSQPHSGFFLAGEKLERCGLRLQTTATLARLLAACCVTGRVQLCQPSGSGSMWQQLMQLRGWQLQRRNQLAWRAALDWILQHPTLKAAAAAEDAAEGAGAAAAAVPPPLVLSATMRPVWSPVPGLTPLLYVVLLDDAAVDALNASSSKAHSRAIAGLPDFVRQLANRQSGGDHFGALQAFMTAGVALARGEEPPAGAVAGAGVSIIDNISLESAPTDANTRPMQVSFLLPADHGLDPEATWVGLLQQEVGTLQCAPLRLSAFRAAPLRDPSPLLLEANHSLSAAGSAGASSATGSGSGTADQPLQLHLAELRETAAGYTATIKLVGGSSSSSSSGLAAEPVPMIDSAVAAVTARPTHELVLRLQQPAGVPPSRLRLLCPVDSKSTKYKLSRAKGTITAELSKTSDPDWPCDLASHPCGLGLISRTAVDALPGLAPDLPQWGLWMSAMFNSAEMAAEIRTPGGGELGEPFFDLRETLKILFVCTIRGKTVYQIRDTDAPSDADDATALYIRVHTPLRRDSNSRPLAICSVVDPSLAAELLAAGKIDQMDEVRRFQSVIMGPTAEARSCLCSRRELRLLRALLVRNSRRMVPTAEQLRTLPLGPDSPWIATFVTPVYPETLGDSKIMFDALPKALKQQVQVQAAAAEAAAAQPGQQQGQRCRVCGQAGGGAVTLLRCSRCKADGDRYCSAGCQKADWTRHKKGCKKA